MSKRQTSYLITVCKTNFDLPGMEVVRAVTCTWSGGSENETRWVAWERCVAGNKCSLLLPSASCKPKTSHVWDCYYVNLHGWNGRNTNETNLLGPKAKEEEWKPVLQLGYYAWAFPFPARKWSVYAIISAATLIIYGHQGMKQNFPLFRILMTWETGQADHLYNSFSIFMFVL